MAIHDGIVAGQFDADVDAEATALALAGAVFYRRLLTASPLGHDDVDGLVAAVLGPAPGDPEPDPDAA